MAAAGDCTDFVAAVEGSKPAAEVDCRTAAAVGVVVDIAAVGTVDHFAVDNREILAAGLYLKQRTKIIT